MSTQVGSVPTVLSPIRSSNRNRNKITPTKVTPTKVTPTKITLTLPSTPTSPPVVVPSALTNTLLRLSSPLTSVHYNTTILSDSAAHKKLTQFHKYHRIASPFGEHIRPTVKECQDVHDLLVSVHGVDASIHPGVWEDIPGMAAGCGNVPNVLDAVIRTILSQNVVSSSATIGKNKMDVEYGRANFAAILSKPEATLARVLKTLGCSDKKAESIYSILTTLRGSVNGPNKGEFSLEYLRNYSDVDVMTELLPFYHVGPKTAACVCLFTLNRPVFAVDTHLLRISQYLGWLPLPPPPSPSKKGQTKIKEGTNKPNPAFYHLDFLIPDKLKYGLHALMISHGRGCKQCSVGGVTMDFVDTCPIESLKAIERERTALEKAQRLRDEKKGKNKVGRVKKVVKENGKGKKRKAESNIEKEEEKKEEEEIKVEIKDEEDHNERNSFRASNPSPSPYNKKRKIKKEGEFLGVFVFK